MLNNHLCSLGAIYLRRLPYIRPAMRSITCVDLPSSNAGKLLNRSLIETRNVVQPRFLYHRDRVGVKGRRDVLKKVRPDKRRNRRGLTISSYMIVGTFRSTITDDGWILMS